MIMGLRWRLFSNDVEESFALRMIALALAWWVIISSAWVGTPTWIWAGAGLMVTVGHTASWLLRHTRLPLRSVAIGGSTIASVVLIPPAVAMASSGNWMPIAQFLMLFQGLTSFELRSRVGLYSSIAIGGVIFFFVSQSALDPAFAVFLIGFATLLLAFLAVSFLLDQAKQAEVRWFKSSFALAGLWSSILVVLLLVSGGVFAMLPKRFSDPVQGSRGILLPMRAGADATAGVSIPDFELVASAMPVSSLAQAEGTAVGPDDAFEDDDAGGGSSESVGGSAPGSGSEGTDDGAAQNTGAGSAAGPGSGASVDDGQTGPANDDGLVMRVRSPVLTYWRGAIFERFDGSRWHGRRAPKTSEVTTSERVVYRYAAPPQASSRPLYSQTYFLADGVSSDTVFAGYAPILASLPSRDGVDGRENDPIVYRVISSLPDFSAENLAEGAPASRLDSRYHQIPQSLDRLRPFAEGITKGAFTDLERTLRIVTFLDRNYEFDAAALDQLAVTSSPDDFLSERHPGTSMDFASATVLLARSVGVPSRLVTGYLPGRRDPFSGTFAVYAGDRHAWAEIYVGGVGWVPFDSAPFPAANALTARGSYSSPKVRALFGAGYGDEVYESVRSSPGWIADMAGRAMDNVVRLAASVVAAAVTIGAWLIAARTLRTWLRRRAGARRYTRLEGDGRSQVAKLYAEAERLLRKVGFAPRGPAQTLSEHSAAAERSLGPAGIHLRWLRRAAHAAAYDPAYTDPDRAAQAKSHLEGLRVAVSALPAR